MAVQTSGTRRQETPQLSRFRAKGHLARTVGAGADPNATALTPEPAQGSQVGDSLPSGRFGRTLIPDDGFQDLHGHTPGTNAQNLLVEESGEPPRRDDVFPAQQPLLTTSTEHPPMPPRTPWRFKSSHPHSGFRRIPGTRAQKRPVGRSSGASTNGGRSRRSRASRPIRRRPRGTCNGGAAAADAWRRPIGRLTRQVSTGS